MKATQEQLDAWASELSCIAYKAAEIYGAMLAAGVPERIAAKVGKIESQSDKARKAVKKFPGGAK